MTSDPLSIFVVYFDPDDYPGKHVVRQWHVWPEHLQPHQDPLIVTDDLESARAALPGGLVIVPRTPGDEKQIVETWVGATTT